MPKFGMPMSKSKDILPDSNPQWKYIFNIEVKGQGHREFMNVRDTWYHGKTLMCQTKYDYVKGQKSWDLNTNPLNLPQGQIYRIYKLQFSLLQSLVFVLTILQLGKFFTERNVNYCTQYVN